MELEKVLLKQAFRRGLLLDRMVAASDVASFLRRFREQYVSVDLIRIGGAGDGGYLVPNHTSSIRYCFSPGVDYTANFEAELSATHGIKSFLADASVDMPPIQDENIAFIPKFLGSSPDETFMTLSEWISDSVGDDPSEMVLQMDIEGAEYDVLIYEPSEVLARFSWIVIEFHDMHRLFQRNFLGMVSTIFEKLYRDFSICHVHPNNCCGLFSRHGIDIPRVLEVSLIRNDIVDGLRNEAIVKLPHPLDETNVPDKKDIAMPEIWWKL